MNKFFIKARRSGHAGTITSSLPAGALICCLANGAKRR